MTPHIHAEILRAIADGKEVEWGIENNWSSAPKFNPLTHPGLKWRIKPNVIVIEEHVRFSESHGYYIQNHKMSPNVRFTFDVDTNLPIKVELI